MKESLRVQMLDAIGITPLVPRFVLSGARLSPQCDRSDLLLSTADATIAVPVPERSVRPALTPAIASSVVVEPSQPPLAKRSAQQSVAQLRLQVNLLQHHARCFSLLPAYTSSFQAEADQFVHAVFKSMGINTPVVTLQTFRWPFANNAKLDQGPAALRQALGSFLLHAVREPASVVLLWGHDLARHLVEDASTSVREFELSSAVRVIAVHRVQDYFSEPLRKRDLWQQLGVVKSALRDK